MPRNGSGTYTLPVNSFNPAVNNTVIDPSDWNDTSSDMADALTDSLSRTGEGGMEADLDMGTHNVTNAGTYNKVTITAPATGSTLTIANGKTLTASVTVTFTGSDGTSFAFPSVSGTVATIDASQALTNKTMSSSTNVLGGVTMTLGSDATGDIYYRNSGGQLARLPIGSNGQVLGVTGGALAYQAGSSAGSVTIGSTTISSGTNNRLLYDNSGTLGEAVVSTGLALSGGNLTTSLTSVANSIAGDVTLNNTNTYFTGPTCAQGTSGTWLATGTVTVVDTGGAANMNVRLTDGTTTIASAFATTTAANDYITISVSGVIASPAGNIRIDVRDSSLASGLIKAGVSIGNSKDSTLTVVRIA